MPDQLIKKTTTVTEEYVRFDDDLDLDATSEVPHATPPPAAPAASDPTPPPECPVPLKGGR